MGEILGRLKDSNRSVSLNSRMERCFREVFEVNAEISHGHEFEEHKQNRSDQINSDFDIIVPQFARLWNGLSQADKPEQEIRQAKLKIAISNFERYLGHHKLRLTASQKEDMFKANNEISGKAGGFDRAACLLEEVFRPLNLYGNTRKDYYDRKKFKKSKRPSVSLEDDFQARQFAVLCAVDAGVKPLQKFLGTRARHQHWLSPENSLDDDIS